VNFYEKALFVKPTWRLYVLAERNSCSALRAMLLFAVIFGRPLLPSLMGRSSFLGRWSPYRVLADPLRVLRMGGRPSHLTFREIVEGEVLRIRLPRTLLNKGKKRKGRTINVPARRRLSIYA